MLTRLPKELWIAVTWSLGGDDITRALSVSWAMRDSVNVHRLVYDRAPKVRSLEMMHVRDTVERMISRRQAIWQETDVRMHFGQRGMIVRRDSTAYIVPEIARLLRAHERLVLRVSGHPDTPGLWFPGVEDVSRAKLYKVREKELKPFTKRRARTLAAALRSEGVARAREQRALLLSRNLTVDEDGRTNGHPVPRVSHQAASHSRRRHVSGTRRLQRGFRPGRRVLGYGAR